MYNILSYLVKNSIQRNMKRRSEKRVGAGREKSLSFTKINNRFVIGNWKIDGKGYICLKNQAFSVLNVRQ